MPEENIKLTVESPNSQDGQTLIGQLTDELGAIYGVTRAGAFRPAEVEVPRAAFIVARLDGEPVGCGAIRPFADDPDSVEVKRMFVKPSARGKGISRLILRKLESLAKSFGYAMIKLETGIHQHEAIGLYTKEGYERIPCYGSYSNDPVSICYAKAVEPEPEA